MIMFRWADRNYEYVTFTWHLVDHFKNLVTRHVYGVHWV